MRALFAVTLLVLLAGAAMAAAAADPAVVKGVPVPAAAAPAPAAHAAAAAAASTKSLLADDGLKPWDITATKTTVSLSWLAFVLLLAAAMMIGTCLGYTCRGSRGDQSGKYLQIDTSAHDLY